MVWVGRSLVCRSSAPLSPRSPRVTMMSDTSRGAQVDAVTPGLPEGQRAWGGNGRDTLGVPGTHREPPGPCQGRVRAARWRRAALGRPRGAPGLPCTSRALARGAGVPRRRTGSSPQPGRAPLLSPAPPKPPPLLGAGRGALPPPPVGGSRVSVATSAGRSSALPLPKCPGRRGRAGAGAGCSAAAAAAPRPVSGPAGRHRHRRHRGAGLDRGSLCLRAASAGTERGESAAPR